MELLILLGCCFLWILLAGIVKDLHADAKQRREDRIMADWEEREAERFHRCRLEAIDRTVMATIDEMQRIADEARGEVIESTAVEVWR